MQRSPPAILTHCRSLTGGTTSLRIGLASLTTGTAWARVEAGKHFPSDVLAGMALGHLIGAFINDVFWDSIIRMTPG